MNRNIKICLLCRSDERGDHAQATVARTSCDQLKLWMLWSSGERGDQAPASEARTSYDL